MGSGFSKGRDLEERSQSDRTKDEKTACSHCKARENQQKKTNQESTQIILPNRNYQTQTGQPKQKVQVRHVQPAPVQQKLTERERTQKISNGSEQNRCDSDTDGFERSTDRLDKGRHDYGRNGTDQHNAEINEFSEQTPNRPDQPIADRAGFERRGIGRFGVDQCGFERCEFNNNPVMDQRRVEQSGPRGPVSNCHEFKRDCFVHVDNAHRAAQCQESNVREPKPIERTNTTKRFFYYPQRVSGEQDETMFVSNSQFPYTKPKAVSVRRRQTEIGGEQPMRNADMLNRSNTQGTRNICDDHIQCDGRHPKLDNDLRNYGRRESRPYMQNHPLSASNARATDDYDREGYVLPHKKVIDLRKGEQIMPYGRHYDYTCDRPVQAMRSVIGAGPRRPPTPVPDTWYGTHRTNDYLVASSLLAMEQQYDRRRNQHNMDVNDF